MKRFWFAVLLCVTFCCASFAQQTAADAPATKEDVEKYFQVTRSHKLMDQMMDAMSEPIHKMLHEEFEKDKDKLPPDFEAKESKKADEMFRNMPWDEMLQAMVPAYQKHFTKRDMETLVAFYSTPTGQKVLRELPAIMSEAMESMMPIMQKHVEAVNKQLQQEIAEMLEQSEKNSDQAPVRQN